MKLHLKDLLKTGAYGWLFPLLLAGWLGLASPGWGVAAAGAQVTLVRDGQPAGKIFVDQPWEVAQELDAAGLRKLKPEEREAYQHTLNRQRLVQDLILHVRLITGADLPVVIVKDAQEITGPGIVIGAPAVALGATPAHQTAMQESLRLLTKDNLVLIGGEGERSYRHGVYELLRRLGCDWLMPGDEGIVTPSMQTLTVPALDVALKPAFEVRAPWYSGGPRIVTAEDYERLTQWKTRQQQTLTPLEHPDFMHGGHMWSSLLVHNRKELDANPELRAQVRQADGTLAPGKWQLEATHPRVIEMSLEYIRFLFERNKWPADKHIAISVGPNDGPGYSESPAALAAGSGRYDPLTGGQDQTDVLIQYTNTLQELAQKEFPNVKLGFLIYSVHSDFPMLHQPNPRFVAHFADITQSRYHSVLDERSPTRTYYRKIVELWSDLSHKQGNPLWYYGYNWNLAENMLPYSKMKIWGVDLPYYHQLGIKGHNNEQDKAWSILGPHNYLMARLGWDATLDWRQVLDDYCAKAFGKGGPAMAQYYLALIEAQETAGTEAGAYGSIHAIFTPAFLSQAQTLLDQAAAAADTPYHQKMVGYFSAPLQSARIYLAFRAAMMQCDFAEAVKQYDAMVAHWDAQNERNPDLVSRYARRYIDWLFKPVAQRGLEYSSGEYQIVYRVPDELSAALDPHDAGAALGLQNPQVPDAGWMKLRTFSSSFNEQGLHFYGQGGIWYRTRFTGPEAAQLQNGRGAGLFVGSVEDEVRVYLNGQYVGSGRGFIQPFAFDLTEHLKPGAENLLALNVVRNSYLNEMGRGGILYPCFVFTGPRLDKSAPINEPLYRVLPGGSLEPITPQGGKN